MRLGTSQVPQSSKLEKFKAQSRPNLFWVYIFPIRLQIWVWNCYIKNGLASIFNLFVLELAFSGKVRRLKRAVLWNWLSLFWEDRERKRKKEKEKNRWRVISWTAVSRSERSFLEQSSSVVQRPACITALAKRNFIGPPTHAGTILYCSSVGHLRAKSFRDWLYSG